MLPQPAATAADIPATTASAWQRIDAMDVLRGFALMGILAMNIEWFNRPTAELGGFDRTLLGVDYAAGWFVKVFIEGKLYKLFALLFGMGFAVMMLRSEQAGRPFNALMSRRLLALLLFGVLHLFLLWNGDILNTYAIGGFALLGWMWLLRRKRLQRFNNPTSMMRFSLLMLAMPFIVMTLLGIGQGIISDHGKLRTRYEEGQQAYRQSQVMLEELRTLPDTEQQQLIAAHLKQVEAQKEALEDRQEANETKETKLDDLPAPQRIARRTQQRVDQRLKAEQDVVKERIGVTSPRWWDATRVRTLQGLKFLAQSPAAVVGMFLWIFLLGYWLVATGRIRRPAEQARFWRLLMLFGLGFGLPLNVAAVTLMVNPASRGVQEVQFVLNGLFMLGQYVLSAGYLGAIVTLVISVRWRRSVLWMAPLGRMALTNYLTHSVILSTLFYGYGAAQFGRIARGPQMLIVVAILAVQWVFSRWWLQRFQYGPMEWVWRCLTYGQRVPLRVAPSVIATQP